MINIEDETRNFGFKIAQKKNYTCFGIASALTRITSAIIADEKQSYVFLLMILFKNIY